jgi:transcriptional regulator with XRE-family HTH domain
MSRPHSYSRQTIEVARILGLEVARARRQRRWTTKELADRAGISPSTLSKVEHGDPTVALGTAFEVASLLGIPLFEADRDERQALIVRGSEHLALLPKRIRHPEEPVHDAF